jgi:hypothetical protein
VGGLLLTRREGGGWWHRETPDVGVVVTAPREGLDEIRSTADEVLPGVKIHRKTYYRYLLRWRRT